MKEKIIEMLEMQKALDDRILDGKPYPLEQMQIALFVELGELMNELPSYFKHWKKSAVDNRAKALEELVDCWHFEMSMIINDPWTGDIELIATRYSWYFDKESEFVKDKLEEFTLVELLENVVKVEYFHSFPYLMHKLGFTFDEIYTEYKRKNAINHERQNGGY